MDTLLGIILFFCLLFSLPYWLAWRTWHLVCWVVLVCLPLTYGVIHRRLLGENVAPFDGSLGDFFGFFGYTLCGAFWTTVLVRTFALSAKRRGLHRHFLIALHLGGLALTMPWLYFTWEAAANASWP